MEHTKFIEEINKKTPIYNKNSFGLLKECLCNLGDSNIMNKYLNIEYDDYICDYNKNYLFISDNNLKFYKNTKLYNTGDLTLIEFIEFIFSSTSISKDLNNIIQKDFLKNYSNLALLEFLTKNYKETVEKLDYKLNEYNDFVKNSNIETFYFKPAINKTKTYLLIPQVPLRLNRYDTKYYLTWEQKIKIIISSYNFLKANIDILIKNNKIDAVYTDNKYKFLLGNNNFYDINEAERKSCNIKVTDILIDRFNFL